MAQSEYRKRSLAAGWALGAATALGLVLSGCGLKKDQGAIIASFLKVRGEFGDVIGAFQALQKVGSDAKCSECHRTSQVPHWMGDDPAKAFEATASYIDFDNPAGSRLKVKAVDSHAAGVKQLLADNVWQSAIDAVVAASKKTGVGSTNAGKFFSERQRLPDTIPTYNPAAPLNAANFVLITFDLSAIHPQTQLEFKLTLERASADDPTRFYRIYDVRLKNNSSSAVLMESLRFIRNGQFDPLIGTLYENEVLIAPPTSSPLISSMYLLIPKKNNPDDLQVSFEKLESTSRMTCNQLANFTSTIKPILETTGRLRQANGAAAGDSCVTCHRGGNAVSTTAFDMRASDDATLCANILSRTDRVALSSPLIQNPEQGATHPRRVYTPTDRAALTSWIDSEWAGR